MRSFGLLCAALLLLAGTAGAALARDELVTSARTVNGDSIPYIVTSKPGAAPTAGSSS